MAPSLGYRKILVTIANKVECEQAMDVACRLAERRASILGVSVVEVPSQLPLDAHMVEEEARAHEALERARAIADLYGVSFTPRIVRGREAARGILDQAEGNGAEIIVIGASRKRRAKPGAAALGQTVEHVLKRASCRVMVIEAALTGAAATRHAAA